MPWTRSTVGPAPAESHPSRVPSPVARNSVTAPSRSARRVVRRARIVGALSPFPFVRCGRLLGRFHGAPYRVPTEAPRDGVESRAELVRALLVREEIELFCRVLEIPHRNSQEPHGLGDLRGVPERHRHVADDLAVGRRAAECSGPREKWVKGLTLTFCDARLAKAACMPELDFEGDGAAFVSVVAEPASHGFRMRGERRGHGFPIRDVALERVLLAVGLGHEVGCDVPLVDATREAYEPVRAVAEDSRESLGVPPGEIADRLDAERDQRLLEHRPDAPELAHRKRI